MTTSKYLTTEPFNAIWMAYNWTSQARTDAMSDDEFLREMSVAQGWRETAEDADADADLGGEA